MSEKAPETNGKATYNDLAAKINARTPIIGIESFEEERIIQTIQTVVLNLNKRGDYNLRLIVWSETKGLEELAQTKIGNRLKWEFSPPNDLEDPEADYLKDFVNALTVFEKEITGEAVLVMKDPWSWLQEEGVNNSPAFRKLRDLYGSAEFYSDKTVILAGSRITPLPQPLEKSIILVDLPLPSHEYLVKNTKTFLGKQAGIKEAWQTPEALDHFAQNGRGLTWKEYEQALAEAVTLRKDPAKRLLAAKKAAIKKTGLLELVEPDVKPEDVGGLDLIKQFLEEQAFATTPEARELGAPIPKGMIVAGKPGTGKSLLAKMLAAYFNIPLVRYDTSRVGSSLYGETERNMRQALTLVESLSPAIFWIDEMEKAFGGGSGDLDGGVSQRSQGILLTWLQERTGYIYIVGTVNHLERMPPELRRSGRFDALFAVDLPNTIERLAIWKIHLAAKKNTDQKTVYHPQDFDLAELVSLSDGWTGAEIETGINRALLRAIHAKEPFSTKHIQAVATGYIPEGKRIKLDKAQLRAMEDALQYCQPASSPYEAPKTKSNATRAVKR